MQHIDRIMELLDEEFKGKFVISDSRIKLWTALLEDIHPDLAMTAALQLCSTGREWPPTIGMMRDKALALQEGELTPPGAHEAWSHVQARIQSDEAPLTDLEHEVLKQVGTVFDLRTSQNPAADRAQFLKAFEAAVERHRIERVTPPQVKLIAAQMKRELPSRRPPTAGELEELVDAPPGETVKAFLKGTGLIDG